MTQDVDANTPELTDGKEARPDDYQFDVFLSYSRKDEEFGKKLEEALENYRLPKHVKTSLISRNRLSVFRDKNDLVPTDTDYYQTIAGYLKRSGNLIVVCSPNARRSQYVNQEIAAFLESHEPKSIIPILLSGRPNNESEANPDEHAFPEALCSAVQMPLALEFTEFERAKGKVSRGRYRDSWYTLLAKIFGAERAEIERVDAKRQARRRAIFGAVSVAIIAMLSVALVFAVISRQEAVRQKRAAEDERDRARRLLYASNINLAQRAFESGNIALGKELLESYLPAKQSGKEDLRGFEWYYLWRLYNQQLASFDATDDIAFSPDGARFATVTSGAVKIWDAATLRETSSVKLNPRKVTTDSADESYLYSSIDFSSDGKTLAYGDVERVLLLDISSGSFREVPIPRKSKERPEESYWDSVKGGTPRFSPDGKMLAISYGCGIVVVYDAHSLKQIIRLGDGPPASGCTSLVTFSPDGKLLAYGNGYSVSLWDTVVHSKLGEPEMDVSQPDSVDQVEAVAFSRDGKLLAIGDRSKQLVLWNISTKKVLARLKGHDEWISALAFSADGKVLYSGSMDQTVKLWDFSSYKSDGQISSEKVKVLATLKGHTGYIRSISSAPARRIVGTVGFDRTARLWGQGAGRQFDSVEDVDEVLPGSYVTTEYPNGGASTTTLFDLSGNEPSQLWTAKGSIALSPDRKTVAVVSFVGPDVGAMAIKLWDASSHQELVTLRSHSSEYPPAFSADGRLFTAVGPDGKSVILWDTAERRELPPVRNDAALKEYFLSRDGKVVVTVDKDGQRVKSWDIASQKELAALEMKVKREASAGNEGDEESQAHMALSPDGKLFAFSYSNEVMLWDASSTQEPVLLAKRDGNVSALEFSPDGKLIAVGDSDGMVQVWDAVKRTEAHTFKGHKDEVTALAFSPDGKTLASGGGASDRTVKLYGIASMRELITLTHDPSPTSEVHAGQGGEDVVSELFFSADDRSLIALSGNNVLRIWRGASDADVSAPAR
jgi:WD40 repeat protein